jgi:hypothetical protein
MEKKVNEDKELITIFNDELEDLRDNLVKMSEMVRNSLGEAIRSLVD